MTSRVSSTPILRTTLIWSAVVTAVLAIAGAVIGYLIAQTDGLWSVLSAVVLAAVFLALTGLSILIANRWYGDDLWVPIFFGIVMGGWVIKFLVFLIALFVLRGQPWLEPGLFLVALIVSIIASLTIDVIVMLRLRVPHVSDVTLPGPEETADDPAEGGADRPRRDGTTPEA